jgi:hypothetical protein
VEEGLRTLESEQRGVKAEDDEEEEQEAAEAETEERSNVSLSPEDKMRKSFPWRG